MTIVCLQSSCAEIIIKQEKQEGICNRLPSILQYSAIESSYAPFGAIYLVKSIDDAFVFALVWGRRRLPELSLDLQSGYDKVKGVDGKVRDRGARCACKGVS